MAPALLYSLSFEPRQNREKFCRRAFEGKQILAKVKKIQSNLIHLSVFIVSGKHIFLFTGNNAV